MLWQSGWKYRTTIVKLPFALKERNIMNEWRYIIMLQILHIMETTKSNVWEYKWHLKRLHDTLPVYVVYTSNHKPWRIKKNHIMLIKKLKKKRAEKSYKLVDLRFNLFENDIRQTMIWRFYSSYSTFLFLRN